MLVLVVQKATAMALNELGCGLAAPAAAAGFWAVPKSEGVKRR